MSNFGFKVAKAGHSVTESDASMAFTSRYYSDTQAMTGVISLPINGASGTATLSHNLGYVPQAYLWEENNYYIVLPCFVNSVSGNGVTIDFTVDATNLTITVIPVSVGSETYIYQCRYIIVNKQVN